MLNSVAFIPAVIALGTAQYLERGDGRHAHRGRGGLPVGRLVGILRIRTNAIVTGVFLASSCSRSWSSPLGIANFHGERIGQLFGGWVGGGRAAA